MKILIAYDGSACSEAAVADLRRAGIPPDAEALVICVVDGGAAPSPAYDISVSGSKAAQGEGKALADTALKWIQSNFPGWKVSRQVLAGATEATLLEKVRSWQPDLLIIGSHGRSLARRVLLGSLSLKLAHEVPCSVRVVRAGTAADHEAIRILVGCDGSMEAESAIQEVARRSWPEGSEVRIITVVDTILPMAYALEPSAYASEPSFSAIQESVDHQRTRFDEIVKESRDSLQKAGLIVTAAAVDGDPKRELVAEAERWKADVIFVGACGLGRLEELLLGSVSTAVLTHAHCAVEVRRAQNSRVGC